MFRDTVVQNLFAVGLADEDVVDQDVESTFKEIHMLTGTGTTLPKPWVNYLGWHIDAGDKGLFLFIDQINKFILVTPVCSSVTP